MTAKEYLSQAYKLDQQAELLTAKADKLRRCLHGSTDVEVVKQVEKYEKDIDRLIGLHVKKWQEIEKAISAVPAPFGEVLQRRYLLYQPWTSCFDKRTGKKVIGIDEAMGYSTRQVYRFHDKGLSIVAKKLKDVSECH